MTHLRSHITSKREPLNCGTRNGISTTSVFACEGYICFLTNNTSERVNIVIFTHPSEGNDVKSVISSVYGIQDAHVRIRSGEHLHFIPARIFSVIMIYFPYKNLLAVGRNVKNIRKERTAGKGKWLSWHILWILLQISFIGRHTLGSVRWTFSAELFRFFLAGPFLLVLFLKLFSMLLLCFVAQHPSSQLIHQPIE